MTGRPFKFSSVVNPLSSGPLTIVSNQQQAQADQGTPAAVTDSWNDLRKVFAHVVPYNVNRQRAIAARFGRIVS